MGVKLLWTGLTMVTTLGLLGLGQPWVLAGAVVMIVGCVLYWLDR